eukprot:8346403-Pyramimonas_sp.AAC.2
MRLVNNSAVVRQPVAFRKTDLYITPCGWDDMLVETQLQESLKDAQKSVELEPKWTKVIDSYYSLALSITGRYVSRASAILLCYNIYSYRVSVRFERLLSASKTATVGS